MLAFAVDDLFYTSLASFPFDYYFLPAWWFFACLNIFIMINDSLLLCDLVCDTACMLGSCWWNQSYLLHSIWICLALTGTWGHSTQKSKNQHQHLIYWGRMTVGDGLWPWTRFEGFEAALFCCILGERVISGKEVVVFYTLYPLQNMFIYCAAL